MMTITTNPLRLYHAYQPKVPCKSYSGPHPLEVLPLRAYSSTMTILFEREKCGQQTPQVGIEPTTLRLTAARSAD